MTTKIHHADVLKTLAAMPDDSFHGCLTDPPYGLSFMSHGWDHGVPSVDVWREVLRVLKPGAHLLAFGGTRTFHRLTCAIEDAGFEVRDCIMWLYGSGYPKSRDVSKAIDSEAGAVREVTGPSSRHVSGKASQRTHGLNGTSTFAETIGMGANITAPATPDAKRFAGYGTALKPAYEPIIVARKPLSGTVAANVLAHGCGGLAIDASRVGTSKRVPTSAPKDRIGQVAKGDEKGRTMDTSGFDPNVGRWPANVILDEEAGAVLDAQTGERPSTLTGRADPAQSHAHPASPDGTRASMFGNEQARSNVYADSGGASRFFYCAKAGRAERDEGVEGRNVHPTVKPLALARYLARLILPPIEDSRLLVPFCGSGTEMLGALQAGWSHVDGIDSWDVAVRIASARLTRWERQAA